MGKGCWERAPMGTSGDGDVLMVVVVVVMIGVVVGDLPLLVASEKGQREPAKD